MATEEQKLDEGERELAGKVVEAALQVAPNIWTNVFFIGIISSIPYLALTLGHIQSNDTFLGLLGVMTPCHGVNS